MDNALFVSLSRQMVLKREMDIVANNIANADTTGFKVETLMTRTEPKNPANTAPGPRPVKFVLDDGVVRNFTQGTLRSTGGTFDVGVEGDGFFTISTAQGDRYTRDGRFHMDTTGRLVTEAGDPVQGEGGGDIVVDPQKGPVSIAKDGTVSQERETLGKIGLVKFTELSALRKTGDNLYSNSSNIQPQPATDSVMHQGMLESSNVNPIVQVTRMIEVSRAYERVTSMMDTTAELSRRSIERLGQVN
ncbi:flagellar basal-body rod protein FlgF [Phenylobacterium sp.]|uniref:flagellar basal-body rod protein FlgF n=1 Tax=Phenylobacterium sp. TaxID=1871053 RepID=UPI0035B145FC